MTAPLSLCVELLQWRETSVLMLKGFSSYIFMAVSQPLIILFNSLISFMPVKWVPLLTETQKHCFEADVPRQYNDGVHRSIFWRTPVQHWLENEIFQVVFSGAAAWFVLQWLSVIQHAAGQKWHRADCFDRVECQVLLFLNDHRCDHLSAKLLLEAGFYFVPPYNSASHLVLFSYSFVITLNYFLLSNYATFHLIVSQIFSHAEMSAFGCYSNNKLGLTVSSCAQVPVNWHFALQKKLSFVMLYVPIKCSCNLLLHSKWPNDIPG